MELALSSASRNSSAGVQVFEEVVAFTAEFLFQGRQVELDSSLNGSSFEIFTRPSGLPVDILVSRVSEEARFCCNQWYTVGVLFIQGFFVPFHTSLGHVS